jgi:hypothetical protein
MLHQNFTIGNQDQPSTLTKMAKIPIYTQTGLDCLKSIISCIQIFTLMSFSVRLHMQMLGRFPMQSSTRCDLCQDVLTVCLCLSLPDLLFMEGDNVSTTLIIVFSGLGKARSTILLGQHGSLSLATTALLDYYKGV